MFLPGGKPVESGSTYHVLDFARPPSARFSSMELPELPIGLEWDTTALYTRGTITVRQAGG